MRSVTRAVVLARGILLAVLVALLIGWQPRGAAAQADQWRAEYYATRYLVGAPALVRFENDINVDWGAGSPDKSVPTDNFSARWTRTLPLEAGTYVFTTRSDDGVRLFVDDQLVIDDWTLHAATTRRGTIALTQGNHAVRLEYFELTGNASVSLSWERTAAQPPPAPQPGATSYTVRQGDTLKAIAARFATTVSAILAANPSVTDPNRIYVGQRLKIPGDQQPQTYSEVKIYLIGLNTGTLGCGDELVPVTRAIQPTQAPLTAALQELLSLGDRTVGQSGLYNALYRSNLHIDDISQSGSTWTVRLSGTLQLGGVCDNPRAQAQLMQTALQFDTVGNVRFFINGQPLSSLLP